MSTLIISDQISTKSFEKQQEERLLLVFGISVDDFFDDMIPHDGDFSYIWEDDQEDDEL